jgi:hypothetical protein
MVHVPGAAIVAVAPLTVHTVVVVEANVIGNPELAVAESATVAPTVWLPTVAKRMVCVAGLLLAESLHPAIAKTSDKASGEAAWRIDGRKRFMNLPRVES